MNVSQSLRLSWVLTQSQHLGKSECQFCYTSFVRTVSEFVD